MEDAFIPPAIGTKGDLGEVVLVPVFRIALRLGERQAVRTARGLRLHQKLLGGTVQGPRLSGELYPRGGGEFGLVRVTDQVEETFGRFMILADNGEWLYSHWNGYVRPDGYARFQALFDADVQGPHAWLNENMFIGSIEQPSDRERVLSYFEAT